MSFQAVGLEVPKEHGPKTFVQDRGTSSLHQLNIAGDDHEPRSVTCRCATSNQAPDHGDTCMPADRTCT